MKLDLMSLYLDDLKQIEDCVHPISPCELCGEIRKLSYDGEGRHPMCNKCWKFIEQVENQMRKEYQEAE